MEGDTLLDIFCVIMFWMNARLQEIAVAESERRRGIGQMLFEFMEQICHEKQLKRMLLMSVRVIRQRLLFMKKTNLESMESESSITEGKLEDAILMSRMV